MKLIKSILFLNLLIVSMAQYSYAQDGVRGGDDGLDYRITAARELAIEALMVAPSLSENTPNDTVKSFYAYSSFLLNEIKTSKILIKPASEVNALVGGKLMERKASTGFTPSSDILINREANLATPVSELTAILIHEVGHHAGVRDENDEIDETDQTLFLNRFAANTLALVAKDRPLFQAKLYGNKPIYELIEKQNRESFSIDYPSGKWDYEVVVDLKSEKVTIIKSKINAAPTFRELLGLPPRYMQPMTINSHVITEITMPPEVLSQFYESNRSHITFNGSSSNPDKKIDYQVTLNFKDQQMNMVTIVPLKKNQPIWRKSLTLNYPF